MMLEIAHHIDNESRYQQVVDLEAADSGPKSVFHKMKQLFQQ